MTQKENDNSFQQSGERIAKVMARAGVCSRRDAEKMIAAGRVSVNGTVLDTPAFRVTGSDQIDVDGAPIQEAEETRFFLYHKPVGVLTTNRDEHGRETVFDDLPEGLPRLLTVGRLDLNTEGLLLLTNDGELSRYLELPATGWKRTYRVRVFGDVNEDELLSLKDGIQYEGVNYGSIDAELEKQTGRNAWIRMTLTEGKNREIRNVTRALGLQVNRLIRISYGPFHLRNMATSEVIEIPEDQLKRNISGFFKK